MAITAPPISFEVKSDCLKYWLPHHNPKGGNRIVFNSNHNSAPIEVDGGLGLKFRPQK